MADIPCRRNVARDGRHGTMNLQYRQQEFARRRWRGSNQRQRRRRAAIADAAADSAALAGRRHRLTCQLPSAARGTSSRFFAVASGRRPSVLRALPRPAARAGLNPGRLRCKDDRQRPEERVGQPSHDSPFPTSLYAWRQEKAKSICCVVAHEIRLERPANASFGGKSRKNGVVPRIKSCWLVPNTEAEDREPDCHPCAVWLSCTA